MLIFTVINKMKKLLTESTLVNDAIFQLLLHQA